MFKIENNLRSALLLGAATAAVVTLPAAAQQTETVVVTGSRIPSTTGLASSSPVTAVSQEEIQLQGTTNVENMLNSLPSVFADQGNSASNGASGTASVDLRNLQPKRTLVLIDGRRLMPGDPDALSHGTGGVADLNLIPAALIDHVEVLTGGSSAVYGSDAVAGVVNFLMRKDFEGVEIDGQYSVANNGNGHWAPFLQSQGYPVPKQDVWDGGTEDFSLVMGINSANGKGNITLYGTFFHQQAITQDARDFSACSTATDYSTGFFCAGSSTIPEGRFTSVDLGAAKAAATSFVPDSTKAFSPYAGQSFNFAPYNYIQRPDTRYTFGAMGHYQMSESVDLYTSLMYMDDHTIANVAPGGAFQTPFLINCDNPLMSAQQQATICPATALDSDGNPVSVTPINGGTFGPGSTANSTILLGRRAIESGPRVDDLRHTQYRIVLGVRGSLDSAWSYDVYAQYGVTTYGDNQTGYWSSNNLSKALQVVSVGGTPTCKSVVDQSDPNCVPIDVFAPASLTPAMLDYVSTNGVAIGETREEIVSASMTGDFGEWGIRSPWAKGALSVAFGGEYREESISYQPDQELRTGDLQGLGGKRPGQAGHYSVGEGFVELRMPVIEDMPMAKRLEASAAYRYSSYSNAGATNTYKVGLEYQPVDDFRLRGSFQHAVRAPNTTELFTPSAVVLFGGQDPCSNNPKTNAPPDLTTKWLASNCLAQGLTMADYGKVFPCPAAQCQQQEIGNIALKPEESDTWSAGIVLTPTFVEGLSMTVDWYFIKVNRAIGQVGALTVLNDCGAGILAACAQIHRDPTTKTLWTGDGYVENPTQNLGFIKTSGIDVETSYLMPLENVGADGYGGLNFNFVGTFLSMYQNQGAPPSSPFFAGVVNCAGLYGPTCAGSGISVSSPVFPRWRHKFRVSWDTPWDMTFSIAWRHLSGVKLDANRNGIVDANPFDAKLPAFDYFDLSASYQATNWFQLRAGVNNVFDKDPPVVDTSNLGISGPPFGNGNTFPQVYDSLGRVLFVSGTIKF